MVGHFVENKVKEKRKKEVLSMAMRTRRIINLNEYPSRISEEGRCSLMVRRADNCKDHGLHLQIKDHF